MRGGGGGKLSLLNISLTSYKICFQLKTWTDFVETCKSFQSPSSNPSSNPQSSKNHQNKTSQQTIKNPMIQQHSTFCISLANSLKKSQNIINDSGSQSTITPETLFLFISKNNLFLFFQTATRLDSINLKIKINLLLFNQYMYFQFFFLLPS